jgi:hypothetical protein
MKVHYYILHSLDQKNKDLRRKKRQPQNIGGSKIKTSDEKKGNPKTQGAQKERPPMKRGNPKAQGAQKNKDFR